MIEANYSIFFRMKGEILFIFDFLKNISYFYFKMKQKFYQLNVFLGVFIFFLAAILLALGISFMKTWFYCFAWWSFILFMDGLNFRKSKTSPLAKSSRFFLYMAFVSVSVWLIFELFNLRVKNWSYHHLPASLGERWLGYFIAFASVIPALKEISFYLGDFLKGRKAALFRIKVTPLTLRIFFFLGLAFIFLPLFRPNLFFPLVWLCFIFLLEPLNYWLKNETFLADLEQRDWSRFWSWVLAGMAAGVLWELFNFWAGSHWEYRLPYFNFWRVFQMPVLGYTGFMPFALEIFAFYQLLAGLYQKLKKRIILSRALFLLFILFCAGCFYLMDTFTVIF